MNPTATREWAEAQDKVFAGEAEPETNLDHQFAYVAQMQITPTNLTIRQNLIWADLYKNARHLYDVVSQFNALRKNGVWLEGASYWAYTRTGMEWYRKRHGLPNEVLQAMNELDASYRAISAPDGSTPLPECSVGGWNAPYELADNYSSPAYFVKRWKDGDGNVMAYLLISLNTEVAPKNLHSHLEAGYFAFCVDEFRSAHNLNNGPWWSWNHRCTPYTGFNLKESTESLSLAHCLPEGALKPLWRVMPPKVTVAQKEETMLVPRPDMGQSSHWIERYSIFAFSWQYLPFIKITRKIEVYPEKVVVTDGGALRRSKVREFRV